MNEIIAAFIQELSKYRLVSRASGHWLGGHLLIDHEYRLEPIAEPEPQPLAGADKEKL